MTLRIALDKQYKDKVNPLEIHGKYPYKLYLEIIGNSNIGKFIVVISEKQIDNVTDVEIQLENTQHKTMFMGNKPNLSSDGFFIKHKVRETTILKVKDTPIHIYRTLKSY